MNCLKSPVSRIGGKYYLTGWITQYIPEHVCYVEPFAGGAKLLFAKEPSPVEILNDIDDDLVNLYRVIQNAEKRQKLINILNETPYSRSIFQSWKHGNKTTLDDIEKAGRYFFLCKASFAGDVERGGFGMPSKGTGRNPARTFRTAIDSLDIIADRLKNTVIECLDYTDCIQRYDSPETLFYCDPPYLNSEHYYGKDCFTLEDHYRLSELLHNIKGKSMVSHYKNPVYDELYEGWNRYTFESFKGSHKANAGEKPKTVEVLYCNFKPQIKTRSLFDE
jgi:DNA adenine methylase